MIRVQTIKFILALVVLGIALFAEAPKEYGPLTEPIEKPMEPIR